MLIIGNSLLIILYGKITLEDKEEKKTSYNEHLVTYKTQNLPVWSLHSPLEISIIKKILPPRKPFKKLRSVG